MNTKLEQGSPSFEAIAVTPKVAKAMLACGTTHLYELLNARELASYRDGKSRKILTSSIRAYVERQVAAERVKPPAGWTGKATKARLHKATVSAVAKGEADSLKAGT